MAAKIGAAQAQEASQQNTSTCNHNDINKATVQLMPSTT
jgi:hypothetical protein